MRTRIKLGLGVVALLLSACGGKADDGGAADGGTPDGGSVETCLGAGTMAQIVVDPGTGPVGCPGHGPRDDGGLPWGIWTHELDAVVTAVTSDTLTLDRCSPAADCTVLPASVQVVAPGLALDQLVAPSTYVHVSASAYENWDCDTAVLVRSIPSWSGVPNPAGTGDAVLFAAGRGHDPAPGFPWSLDTVQTAVCLEGYDASWRGTISPSGDYAWRIGETAATAVQVAQGDSVSLSLGGAPYSFRNLSSWIPNATDTGGSFSYWLARGVPASDGGVDAPLETATDAQEEPLAACTETNDRATIWWVEGGVTTGCPGNVAFDGSTPSFDLDVQVQGATADTLRLDACGPAMNCIRPIELHVQAPGLVLSDVVKAPGLAHVSLSFDGFWGCHATLVVRSLASWEGVQNPAGLGDALLLAAIDGGLASPAPDVFSAAPVGLGCNLDAATGCGGAQPVDDYLWRFTATGGAAVADVPMGATRPIALGGHGYHARDLRSYQSTACDDYWNWAYWLARDP